MKSMYYVYLYLNEEENVNISIDEFEFKYRPIYVGKGKGSRMYQHLTECMNDNSKNYLFWNKLRKMIINKNNPKIIKLKEFSDESEALKFEIYLISELGKYKDGGYLYNLTDGGDGVSGYRHTEDTKKKFRKNNLGKRHTEETKIKMSESHIGLRNSKEHNDNISKARKGMTFSYSHKKSLSKARIGKKSWNYDNIDYSILQYDMCGILIKEWFSLVDLSEEGYQKSNVINVCKGLRKSHKGFRWEFKK